MLTLLLPAASLLALGWTWHCHRRRRATATEPLIETVRRHRRLQRRLVTAVGNELDAQTLVRTEAARLGISATSPEARVAALKRIAAGKGEPAAPHE